MGRKITGVLITIGLMLSLCLTASIPVMAAATWYVDDSNTSGTEDGSAVHPYNTIGEAITAASAGDTIIVAEGTYSESRTINKPLTVMAAIGELVNINPGGFAFTVNGTSNVTIDGFTLTGGITIINSYSCIVTNNIFISGAISISNANVNNISNNVISNWDSSGISVSTSYGNTITNNIISNTRNAISLSACNGNTIGGNTITGGAYARYGIWFGNDNNVDNIIICNAVSGASQAGIYLQSGADNTFVYNTLDSNVYSFFFANGGTIDAGPIYFRYNNITNSSHTGVRHWGSGTLDASYNYWLNNLFDTYVSNDYGGTVTTDNPLASPISYTYPLPSFITTTTTTTTSTTISTTTSTTTSTITDTTVVTDTAIETTTQILIGTEVVTLTETSTSTTTDTSTVTLLNPTTTTETQSFTSTDTLTSTATQSVTSTDTQSLTYTVTIPQTITNTATTTLTLTEETVDWPVIIFISIVGLLAGGLIISIMVRRT